MSAVMSPEEKKRRLVWQCRRGLKETDVVLNAYLEQHFLADTAANQALFERLLACHDADMFEWFTGRSVADDEALDGFVRHMLALLGRKD